MRHLALLLASLCVLLAGLLPGPVRGAQDAAPAAAPPIARTVILVRHAEKDAESKDPRDPSLSAAGQARAEELARLLGASAATHLYTSELRRTRETLAPLAARLGIASEALPAAKPEDLLARLDALPAGAVAVVCGHSNTVPRIASLLGVEIAGLVEVQKMPMLADESYDRVFVITRPASGPASCLELAYGAPAAPKTSSAGK